MALTETTY